MTFAITWHFPNVQRFQHAGNLYSRRWPDALAVARYVAEQQRRAVGNGRGCITRPSTSRTCPKSSWTP